MGSDSFSNTIIVSHTRSPLRFRRASRKAVVWRGVSPETCRMRGPPARWGSIRRGMPTDACDKRPHYTSGTAGKTTRHNGKGVPPCVQQ